jgi:hypothetical protein
MPLPFPRPEAPHALIDWCVSKLKVWRFKIQENRDKGTSDPLHLEDHAALSYLISFLSRARRAIDFPVESFAEKEPAPWLIDLIEKEGVDRQLARKIALRLVIDTSVFRNADIRPGWHN